MQVLDKYTAVSVPLTDIKCDETFNCRGVIDRTTVINLAKDIKARGLSTPIQVHNWGQDGFQFRIVSGHRRYLAFKHLGLTDIPAIIRNDLITEDDIRGENIRENVQREDLDFDSECKAIGWYVNKGYTTRYISEQLGMSAGWVDVRRKYNDLPDYIHSLVRDGVANIGHITTFWESRFDPNRLKAMVLLVQQRHQDGEKAIVINDRIKVHDFTTKKRPKPADLDSLMNTVARLITNKIDEEEYFAHRVLAYALGNISGAELYISLQVECVRLGLPFDPPPEIKDVIARAQRLQS